VTVIVVGLCGICGEMQRVRAALVSWVVPVFGQYEAIDRCEDVDACKERVLLKGEPWPIREPKDA